MLVIGVIFPNDAVIFSGPSLLYVLYLMEYASRRQCLFVFVIYITDMLVATSVAFRPDSN